MKRLSFPALALALFTLLDPHISQAQNYAWTWVGGSDSEPNNPIIGPSQPGVYGTPGVPAPANTPGGRGSAVTWTDHNGSLWLFGGFGTDINGTAGILNDLWMYDTFNLEWAWMGGSDTVPYNSLAQGGNPGIYGTRGTPADTNIPGSRTSAASWVDVSGNFWLFGGSGFDKNGTNGWLNDLWMYNTTTHQWTWMTGSDVVSSVPFGGGPTHFGQPGIYGTLGVPASTNTPGGRWGSATWIDKSGNLWLFAGAGDDSQTDLVYLNDMWMYSISSNEWTWMGGADLIPGNTAPGVYGVLGVPAKTNLPGTRYYMTTWQDINGKFWLFGGSGWDSLNHGSVLNDIWMFDSTTAEWTWEGGSDLANQPGVYGARGAGSTSYIPGARSSGNAWVDNSQNVWLFAGFVYDGNQSNEGVINDLWQYTPSTGVWAWMGGSQIVSQAGIYGTKGIINACNMPGARFYGMNWPTLNGTFWLLGGNGVDSRGLGANLNDLWTFQYNVQLNLNDATILWSPTTPIQSGTPLSSAQFNATANYSGQDVTSDGTFTYYVGPITNGILATTSTILPFGTNKLCALWTPNTCSTTFNTASLCTNIVVQGSGATPTLSWTPASPITYPAPLSAAQFNANVLSGSTNINTDGTFVYYVGPVVNGVIANTNTILPVGTDQLCVQWTPSSKYSSTYNSVSGCANVQVISNTGPAPTTTSITSSQNPVFVSNPITFTASVTSTSGTPSGTVNFYDSNTIIGSGTLSNGQASFTTSSLIVGAHTIVARFVANSSFAGSTSGYVSEYVDDFTISNAPSIIIPPVSSASMTFTVTPLGPSFTLPQNVTATVTGIPSGVQYSFNPTLIPGGQSTTALSLFINSPIQASIPDSLHNSGFVRTAAPLLLSLLLLPFASIFRRTHKRLTRFLLLAVLTLAGALSFTSCGSLLKSNTSTVTVTATSGSLSHAATFQLTLE